MMLVGCGQVTWRDAPEAQALRDIEEAGYDGSPPKLAPERSAASTLDLYRRHGLRPAPCYFNAELWRRELRDEIVAGAHRAAVFSRELGCRELYVAAGGAYQAPGGRARLAAAGHVTPADGLTAREARTLADTLTSVAEVTLQEGVRSCFHNHVGTVVETEEEIERLLASTDAALVFLGPDTGHLAWAGVDPVELCRRHADRILTLHLKDVDADVCRRGREEGWDYATFAGNGVFAELGEGGVDVPGLLALLRERGFDGWLIVETDVPRRPTALESAIVSRRYLLGLGL